MIKKVVSFPRQFVDSLPADAVEIPGFQFAFASPSGDIFSTRTGRILKLRHRLSSAGYMQVGLFDCNGIKRSVLVHRILAGLFVAGDTTLTVDHRDGNRVNNSIKNLRWLSRPENVREGRLRHLELFARIRKEISHPVRGRHVVTGEVREFSSLVEATRELSRQKKNPKGIQITRALRSGKPAYGFYWEHLQ